MTSRPHDQHCPWCDCEEFAAAPYWAFHHLSLAAIAAVKADYVLHPEQKAKPTRFCMPCEKWMRERECPQCGAETVKGAR